MEMILSLLPILPLKPLIDPAQASACHVNRKMVNVGNTALPFYSRTMKHSSSIEKSCSIHIRDDLCDAYEKKEHMENLSQL